MSGLRDSYLIKRLLDLPIRRKLYCIIGILVADLALVIAAGIFGMAQLSSLRAYVGGEGLWAKAQKNALYSLSKYALTHDEADYNSFLDYLSIPAGDHRARLELEKARPDYAVSDAAFVAGGNHPEDVRGMALLFRRFYWLPDIRQAIALWTQGDALAGQLRDAAEELHRGIASRTLTPAQVRQRFERIDALNVQLTRLENGFSETLGDASRLAKRALFWFMLAAALLLGCLSLGVSLLISGSISSSVQEISGAAHAAAQGDLRVRVWLPSRDELGRLGADFNEMVEGLSRIERLKNDFIATVSHELRTPMTLTLAPLESLLAGDFGPLSAEQTHILRVMHNNAVRQLQLVSGMLDFSRLEAGKTEVRREALDAAGLARAITDDFRPIAGTRGLTLTVQVPERDPALLDRYLFERILFNLLSNALKFTPKGGRVEVSLSRSGERLRLEVKDTGIGIALEDQRRLFERFRQVESSSTRRFEGAGLGLALVKEFSGLLGGSVALESAPGEGSAFRVEFSAPAADGAPQVQAANPVDPAYLLPRYDTAADAFPREEASSLPEVLLAEDNPELARYLEQLLRPVCRLRHAEDGEHALELARATRPDLVIADVMMPRRDGLSLCRELKSADPAVCVVLLTALTDRDSMTRGWEAGADEYLFKPFHPHEVVTRVRALLAGVAAKRRAADALKRKARELELANQEIQAANRDLESFSYSVVHDLRAPLRKIGHASDALALHLGSLLSGETLGDLMKIRDSLARLDNVIEGIFHLSRVSHQAFSPEVLDLSALAKSLGEELARAEPQRSVSFTVAPGLSGVADPAITQVLLANLLENAWKFTSKRAQAHVELGARAQGGETVYFVRDDGAGFDPGKAGSLFNPFIRLHSSSEYPGNGVGLATVQRAVQRHGGRVWAEAQPGKGACFYFTLAPAPETKPAPMVSAKDSS